MPLISAASSVEATKALGEPTISVVHCWTAPRSRSTALLYSFEARGLGCVAIDEPLKREWLIHQGDAVFRPYKINMIQGVPPSDHRPEEEARLWQRELKTLPERIQEAAQKLSKSTTSDDLVIFCKHMSKTHFLFDFDGEIQVEGCHLVHKHMFLVRDPTDILRSWDVLGHVHNNSCSVEDVGIVPLLSIYDQLQQKGESVVILDMDDLVRNPEGVISGLCSDLQINYSESMMSWKAGRHECDSPHALWWYPNVHKSTGWIQSNKPIRVRVDGTPVPFQPLNPKLMPALQESLPAYQLLSRK